MNNRLCGGVLKSSERIVQNSISLFKEKGFNATSIQEIVQATNLTKGSLYNHFRSKGDLLRKVVEVVETDFFEYIKIKDNKNVDEILLWTAQFFLNNECCLMTNLMGEKLSDEHQQDVIRFFRNWEDKITLSMDDKIPEEKKRAFAQDVIVSFEGGIVMKRVHNSNEIIHRYYRELSDKYDVLVATYSN